MYQHLVSNLIDTLPLWFIFWRNEYHMISHIMLARTKYILSGLLIKVKNVIICKLKNVPLLKFYVQQNNQIE
jgi:hypothetical protein